MTTFGLQVPSFTFPDVLDDRLFVRIRRSRRPPSPRGSTPSG